MCAMDCWISTKLVRSRVSNRLYACAAQPISSWPPTRIVLVKSSSLAVMAMAEVICLSGRTIERKARAQRTPRKAKAINKTTDRLVRLAPLMANEKLVTQATSVNPTNKAILLEMVMLLLHSWLHIR